MKEELERIIQKIEEQENTHDRVMDKEMIGWFRTFAYPVLNDFCSDDETRLEQENTVGGVIIRITGKSIMLLDVDVEMHQILQRATLESFEANEDRSVTMVLWFRFWKWKKKDRIDG